MNTIYIENIKGLTSEIAKSSKLINMLSSKYKLLIQGYISTGDNHVIVCNTNIEKSIINLFMEDIIKDINNIIRGVN